MAGHCEGCRWWAAEEEFKGAPEYRACQAPGVYRGYGVTAEAAASPKRWVMVENDEGWGMLTHRTFGCVLWEAPDVD